MKLYVNKKSGDLRLDLCGCEAEGFVLLKENDTDAALEKHVPVVKVNGNTVCVDVGSVAHPMTEEHFISYIVLKTNYGAHVRKLACTDKPAACFALCDGEKAEAAYEYCTLHGLWVTKL
ncbi:MAG: desulfoferrodoxin [Clostridiales bacterium]|nr:desulfoferrodoxin [Clostridiales bacterium]